MPYGSRTIISSSASGGDHIGVSIVKIDKITLSTPHLVWLHENAWEPLKSEDKNQDLFFFYNGRLQADNRLCCPPPFCIARRNHQVPHLAGRWILKSKAGDRLGWAEAITFGGDYARVQIIFGTNKDHALDESIAIESLSLLASACMTITEASVVEVLPASQFEENMVNRFRDFSSTSVWVPTQINDRTRAGRLVKIGKIDSASWWETESGQVAAKQVAYLKTRMDFRKQAMRKKNAPPKRRFSLIRMFFPRFKV